MFFTIKSSNALADLTIYRAKKQARAKILLNPLGTTELLIDNYLRKTYNTTIRKACLDILNNMKFYLNLQGEIIVKIPDKQLNEIARIITYGTGKLIGSSILRNSLFLT